MALAIPNELEKLREGAKRFLGDFTTGQKAVVGIAFVAVIVGIVAYVHYSAAPSYAPLYTNLSTGDAASITAKLQSQGVPFQLADNGTTVMVPQNDVYSERASLAMAGLPNQQKNVGLSKVDSEGITTSAFQQTVDYQQGLQGELQSTIDAISGVQSSQVNLVLPNDNQLVLNNSPKPSAAVLVTLQPGASLSNDQVQAIVHLVASSAPGLSASDVTVTDSAGDLLAGPGANQDNLKTNQQQTALFENGLAKKIQDQIAPLVGPNNASVNVTANLNYNVDNKVIHGLMTNPDGTVQSTPSKSTQTNEQATGTSVVPGGTAGAVLSTGNGSGVSTFTNNGVTQDFTIGKYTETIQKAQGGINTLDVSVLVNSRALAKGIKVNDIYQLVATTAGIDNARGDIATVEALPFSTAVSQAQAQAAQAQAAQNRHNEIINALRVAGVLLVILIILYLIYRSARRPEEIVPEELPALGSAPFDEEDYFAPEEELGMPEEEEGALEPTAANPFDVDLAEGIPHELETSSIGEFIENQPDEVARLLRAWMQETKLPSGQGQRQTESV